MENLKSSEKIIKIRRISYVLFAFLGLIIIVSTPFIAKQFSFFDHWIPKFFIGASGLIYVLVGLTSLKETYKIQEGEEKMKYSKEYLKGYKDGLLLGYTNAADYVHRGTGRLIYAYFAFLEEIERLEKHKPSTNLINKELEEDPQVLNELVRKWEGD